MTLYFIYVEFRWRETWIWHKFHPSRHLY